MKKRVIQVAFVIMMLLMAFWLYKRFYHHTIDAGQLSKYIRPLDTTFSTFDAVGQNVKIMAIGESAHGSAEFNRLRLNIFKRLVANCGYKLFLIEGDFGKFLPLSRYVETGEGNVNELLDATGAWIWNTQELKDIILWMRNYNATHQPQDYLHFYGIDLQGANGVFQYLTNYAKIPSTDTAFLHQQIRIFRRSRKSDAYPVQLQKIITYLKAAPSLKTDSVAELCINILQERLKVMPYDKSETVEMRDGFLAQNITFILDTLHKNSKAVLAAHNYHVSANPVTGKQTCGTFLRKKYGQDYYALFVDFAKGSTRVMNNQNSGKYELPLADKTLSAQWYALQKPEFFINLHTLPPKAHDLLNQELRFHNIGSTYRDPQNAVMDYNLARQFDGYVYLPEITESNQIKR